MSLQSLQARVLIQQAKTRGQVTLVVASRSAASSMSKQPQSRSSGSDVSRDRGHHLAEGVVLRDKKSKSVNDVQSLLAHVWVKINTLLLLVIRKVQGLYRCMHRETWNFSGTSPSPCPLHPISFPDLKIS